MISDCRTWISRDPSVEETASTTIAIKGRSWVADHHKRMSKSIDWKEIRTETIKTKIQFEQSDQSSKYYTLAEEIELKKSGVLPLGFNEHTKILRSSNLTNLSVGQPIKSIINAWIDHFELQETGQNIADLSAFYANLENIIQGSICPSEENSSDKSEYCDDDCVLVSVD